MGRVEQRRPHPVTNGPTPVHLDDDGAGGHGGLEGLERGGGSVDRAVDFLAGVPGHEKKEGGGCGTKRVRLPDRENAAETSDCTNVQLLKKYALFTSAEFTNGESYTETKGFTTDKRGKVCI